MTPWTEAHQAPLSMECSRPEYWSEWPFPPPGDLLNPGTEPRSPTLQADLPSEPPGRPDRRFHFLHCEMDVIFKVPPNSKRHACHINSTGIVLPYRSSIYMVSRINCSMRAQESDLISDEEVVNKYHIVMQCLWNLEKQYR